MSNFSLAKVRHAENCAYLTALDYAIQKRTKPDLEAPANPYHPLYQKEEHEAWRIEFEATVKRHHKPGIAEREPEQRDFNDGRDMPDGSMNMGKSRFDEVGPMKGKQL